MYKTILTLLTIPLIVSCESENSKMGQTDESANAQNLSKANSKIDAFYKKHHQDSLPSKSIGSVSHGQLKNGELLPFQGRNFKYFDTASYLNARAFAHQKVTQTVVQTYNVLADQGVDRLFQVMECSNKDGGKIFPHRTHQNGLSVDFMMPLKKNNKPYYTLDNIGATHYLLQFDKNGCYSEDNNVSIDFDVTAKHILELEKQARKNGLRINKVIFNTHLLDELFSSIYGQKLKQSGIYVTRNLTPLINDLHDDHYHVDFQILKQ